MRKGTKEELEGGGQARKKARLGLLDGCRWMDPSFPFLGSFPREEEEEEEE